MKKDKTLKYKILFNFQWDNSVNKCENQGGILEMIKGQLYEIVQNSDYFSYNVLLAHVEQKAQISMLIH